MKWRDATTERPPHGEKIWVWDNELRAPFVINYLGSEESWNEFKNNPRFPLWAYIYESQPERLNETAPKGDAIV